MDLIVNKFKSKSNKKQQLMTSDPDISRVKVKSENVAVKVESSTDEVTSVRQNLFNLYAPTFLEGGPPTMVPIPTNVPLYPSFSSLSWMRKKLPVKTQIDYYDQLLQVIAEMRKEIHPILSGNKNASERAKRCIQQSRLLISVLISEMIEKEKIADEMPQKMMMMTNDRQPIAKVPMVPFKGQICVKPCCQVGVGGGGGVFLEPTPINKLANQTIKLDPNHPVFQPLTIDCPDYPDIRYNKMTSKPITVRPGTNDPNLIQMWDPNDRLLIMAPKWSQSSGQLTGQNCQ